MLVAGAVEVHGGTPRRARLKVIEGFGKDEIYAFVLGAVAPNTKLVTDDWSSYNGIPEIKHKAITVGPMADTAISAMSPAHTSAGCSGILRTLGAVVELTGTNRRRSSGERIAFGYR